MIDQNQNSSSLTQQLDSATPVVEEPKKESFFAKIKKLFKKEKKQETCDGSCGCSQAK